MSKARYGKLHDKKFHDEEDIAGSIPDEIPIELDLGFLGVDKQYDNICIPTKNESRGINITAEGGQSSLESIPRRV